jgi:hypothetical protein
MLSLQKVKRWAAILLLCALFLPLSRCGHDDPSIRHGLMHQVFPISDEHVSYEYAFRKFVKFPEGLYTALAFGWPLLFVFLGPKIAERRFEWLFHVTAMLFCLGSLWWLVVLTFFGDPLYGGYLYFVSVVTYFAASVWSLVHCIRRALASRRQRKIALAVA